MGKVYRARDTRLGRDAAIKVLPAVWVSDAERRERFEREARAAAALNHPNIVGIHDVGTDAGVPFIISELEGATLRDQMTPGAPWPVRKAVDVALAIANGLAPAHGRGIVHRDLKRENVFISRDGVVTILDYLALGTMDGGFDPEQPTLRGRGATAARQDGPRGASGLRSVRCGARRTFPDHQARAPR
jgi:serine/threonine protein kinase